MEFLINSFAYVKKKLVFFLLLIFKNFSYFVDTSVFVEYVLKFLLLIFVLSNSFLHVFFHQKFKNLIVCFFNIFLYSKSPALRNLPNLRSGEYSLVFTSKYFIVLAFTFIIGLSSISNYFL